MTKEVLIDHIYRTFPRKLTEVPRNDEYTVHCSQEEYDEFIDSLSKEFVISVDNKEIPWNTIRKFTLPNIGTIHFLIDLQKGYNIIKN